MGPSVGKSLVLGPSVGSVDKNTTNFTFSTILMQNKSNLRIWGEIL